MSKEFIFSKIDSTNLLHIVYKNIFLSEEGRIDLSPPEEFLQISILNLQKNKKFRPHKHIYKNGKEKVITQESWIIISGSVKVFLYDIDDSLIYTKILEKGDCIITYRGGHTYEIVGENTIVYECKTGPYQGQEKDKEFLYDKD